MPDHDISDNDLMNGKKAIRVLSSNSAVSLIVSSNTDSGHVDKPEQTEATLRSVENLKIYGDLGGDRLDFIVMGLTEADLSIVQMGDDTHITTTLGINVVLLNVLATDLNSDDCLTL